MSARKLQLHSQGFKRPASRFERNYPCQLDQLSNENEKTSLGNLPCLFPDLPFSYTPLQLACMGNNRRIEREQMAKRRLQKYVDREVQSSLLVRLCAHWLLFMFANLIAVTLWTRFMDTPTEAWEATFALTWHRVVPFVLVSLAIAPVFIWDAVKLSNRFAGPIVRVRQVLERFADGHDFKAVEFRQGDFWKSLASDLNRAFSRKLAAEEASANEKR